MHCSKGTGGEGNEGNSLSCVWLFWGRSLAQGRGTGYLDAGVSVWASFIYRTGLLLADILPRDLVGQTGTGGVFGQVRCNDCGQRIGYLFESCFPTVPHQGIRLPFSVYPVITRR